jgi:hypothetical protein
MIEGPVLPKQFIGVTQPDGTHRMVRTQFVAGKGVLVDKSSTTHFLDRLMDG